VSVFFSLDPLRPEAFGSLETRHVTFGCQRSARRSKGGPVHISWKCRNPAPHTTSTTTATSSASLWMVSLGLGAPHMLRHTSSEWRRLSARFPGGQNHKAPSFQWAETFSPGWKTPDTQIRNPAGKSQVCMTCIKKNPTFLNWTISNWPLSLFQTLMFLLAGSKGHLAFNGAAVRHERQEVFRF